MSVLDLDLGNSNLKWRIDGGPARRCPAGELSGVLPDALSGQAIERIRLCSVGADPERLQEVLERACPGAAVERAAVAPDRVGLACGYSDPGRLGVDRWCALLGAREIARRTLVADIGTALTIDYLDGDAHLGGYIVPGLDLMVSSLVAGTAGIRPQQASMEDGLAPARNTGDALRRGALLAAVGLIERAALMHGEPWPVLLSGGGARLIAGCRPDWDEQPDLVLEGLAIALP
ncbi:MAG: type III pantothenate kinase [Gammaproteobacteria bacterium AqS3]|nr:type III pantothenate kinase [Gammaproteobacteria bacterium AqS3]